MKRQIMLTVDVEAQPARAPHAHIDRLIYGRLGGDADFGIGRMFDIADRHDVGLTCYLDYAERFLYGDDLLQVGRYIMSRKQDLQVHLHPEFIPRTLFEKAGVKYGTDMFSVDREQASFLIDFAIDAHMEVAPEPPVAFRGGGYRYCGNVLNRLRERGCLFNSGYNPSRKNQPLNIGGRKQFLWDNGVVELPISCVQNFKNTGRLFDYNFNADVLIGGRVKECVEKHEEYLRQYFGLYGDDAIAVMVMHSWSFMNINGVGHYDTPNESYVEKFDALLSMLSKKYKIITAKELASADVQKSIGDVVSYNQKRAYEREKEWNSFMRTHRPSCSVCGAGSDRLQDFNGPKRKCGVCGALERQRAFATLLKSGNLGVIKKSARVLLISPSVSERKLFSALPGGGASILDIREEVSPDIVADLCDMPNVPSNSFDVVYACHVLSHVHDLPAALSELARVLSDDGVFINYEPISKNSNTKNFSEIEEITSYYGIEVFEKYKIGRFRNFGELDVEKIFSPFFSRRAYDAMDEVTGEKIVWNLWRKKAGGSCVVSDEIYRYALLFCPVCQDELADSGSEKKCRKCGSSARLRSLLPFVDEYLRKEIAVQDLPDKPLLAFAMTAAEKKILVRAFRNFKSVSLFGNYGVDHEHETGVDVRDLSRYESNAFSGVFGCLIFDYFIEHELALKECFRVIAPGGIFFIQIAPYRLVDGNTPPLLKGKIKPREGYFEYLPNGTELPDVKVGRDWLVDAIKRAGFQPAVVSIEDAILGVVSEWFVGVKGRTLGLHPSAASLHKEEGKKLDSRISEVFHSVIPFGENGRASLKIELIEGLSSSLVFLEDSDKSDNIESGREIVGVNGSRNCIYISSDLGRTWVEKYRSVKWDDKIRAGFSLRNGGRLIRTFSGRMYHLNNRGDLLGSHDTGPWHWHGSQGIGESATGTVMYGEYAPLQVEDGVQQLSVWRYNSNRPEFGWARIFSLPAAAKPPEGQLRHFHVCRPNPGNPNQWVLASGDSGVHNRLWLSNDDGDNWREIKLAESNVSNFPKADLPQLLRFTQFSVLDNGDLIWGTDDITGSNRAALVQFTPPRATGENPAFNFLGWLGKNCVRNIASCGNNGFLMLSESIHDVGAADCILYDASCGRVVPLLLPNISQKRHPVTDSLGSAVLKRGFGFYPALGAVLMNPNKRGIFKISIEEVSR